MRLIDAERLFLHLNDYSLQEAPFLPQDSGDAYNAIINCMRAILEAPTIKPYISQNEVAGPLVIKYREEELANATVVSLSDLR